MNSSPTTSFPRHPLPPEPQLAVGSVARILYGKHRDRRARIIRSKWNPERGVWLYSLKRSFANLGEYAADELWL